MTPITLRPHTPADIPAVTQLVFDAFASIHDRHHFPRDFPTLESAQGFAEGWLRHPTLFGVLAVRNSDQKIVGCNFLDERNVVPGVGPICIDPNEQGGGIGRSLMQAVIDRGHALGAKSIRLIQDAFNMASLSLYASLGFVLNDPVVEMRGKITNQSTAGARPMTEKDLPACAELCRKIHGFDRNPELADALKMFKPFVVERGGQITAYMTSPTLWFLNHGVAESGDDMKTLLAGASAANAEPLAFTVPTRNADFFRWCLAQKVRVQKPMSLMTLGEYREPAGWWFPSVEY